MRWDFGGISNYRCLGTQGEEDQDHRTEDEHVVSEVEDRTVEADGIDMEMHEVADVPVDQAIVTVAQGARHDQTQGDRQCQAGRGTTDEEPVADRDPGHDRETREDLAAVRQRAAKTPQSAGVETGLELEDPADDRGRGSRGLADPGEDHRLDGQVEGRATQGDGPE